MPDPPAPAIPKVRQPERLVLGSSPVESWKLFKQRWTTYSVLSKVPALEREIQVALLLDCLADDALKTYNGFTFDTPEDQRTVTEIIAKFEEFAVGQVNVTYERYLFNRRKQAEEETFDAFLSDLRSLVKTCQYCDNCRNSLVRDRIVLGVNSPDVRSDLLKERELTLDKAIDICRSSESAAKQSSELKPEQVSKVAVKQKPRFHKPRSKETPEKDCKFCDSAHVMQKSACPAWGQTCKYCKEENHFASKCPKRNRKSQHKKSKKVHQVRYSDSSSEADDWVSVVNAVSKDNRQLKCKLVLGSQPVVFQVDTGATINVLPQKFAKNVVPNGKKQALTMWNNSTTLPLGSCRIPVRNPKTDERHDVKFTVVEDTFMPLIGLRTAMKMRLIEVLEQNMEIVAAVKPKPIEES